MISFTNSKSPCKKNYTESWIKIFKLPFTFLQFISGAKKSHWVTQLLQQYTWSTNPKIWLATSIFGPSPTKNLQIIFYNSQICISKNPKNSKSQIDLSIFTLDIVDSRILNLIGWEHYWPHPVSQCKKIMPIDPILLGM